MNWQKNMNQVLDYIESNLSRDIDYIKAAQMMNCSEWEFRRIFSSLAQIPLSEYIRRRRLTMAAADIQNGDKIIDVAIRYGYESPSAFSRAFRRFHGFAPSLARDRSRVVRSFPRLTFQLILMEGDGMSRRSNGKTNIIGAGETGYAVSIDRDQDTIHKTNRVFWNSIGNDLLGTMTLPLYGSFISEDQCRLFGDVSGKKLLETGCGAGGSLEYMAKHNAAELWGTDISEKQIEKAKKHLETCGIKAALICAPMEKECGIPENYFDFVYSVYAVGWTADLEGTFRRIASYLKKDGIFIFSWSHPIHKCVASENGTLVFKKSYFDESWYSAVLDGGTLCLADRKLSTYVNALAKAGFIIEEMIEQSDPDLIEAKNGSAFSKKAKMLPVTVVFKAKKL